jgi:hypothetical protein
MILERVENAQREAGPDRYTEIKRHPDNLVLPLSKVVRHDPARAHVTEALERSQKLAAIGNLARHRLRYIGTSMVMRNAR